MTIAQQFEKKFGVSLNRFISSITGFDVIGFNNHLQCGSESMQEVITQGYGIDAYLLVESINKLSEPGNVDIKAIFC